MAIRLEAIWTAEAVRQSTALSLSARDTFAAKGDFSGAARNLRRAAQLQFVAGEADRSIETINSADALSAGLPPLEAVKTLALRSHLLLKVQIPDGAEAAFSEARELAERSGEGLHLAFVARTAGELKEQSGEWAAAQEEFALATTLFRQAGEGEELARTLVLLAGVRVSTGEYQAGLENVDEALHLFARHGNKREFVMSHIDRGHMLGLLGRKQESLDAYKLVERHLPVGIARDARARLLAGLGYAYDDLGEAYLSLAYRTEALKLFEEGKKWISVGYLMPMLVDLSFRTGDEAGALSYAERGKMLAEQLGHKPLLACTLAALGDHYAKVGNDPAAIEQYELALEALSSTKLDYLSVMVHNDLGMIRTRRGDHTQARRHLEEALSIARQLDNDLSEAESLYNLASLDLAEGHIFSALQRSQAVIDQIESLSGTVQNHRLRSSHFDSVSQRYEQHIEILMRASEATGDPAFVKRALLAADRSRARSIGERLTVRRDVYRSEKISEKENRLLEALHRAADERNEQGSNAVEETIAAIHRDLEELRADARSEQETDRLSAAAVDIDLDDFRDRILDSRTALIEFYVGQDASYGWVADKQEIVGFRLPGRAEIGARVDELRELLSARLPGLSETVDQYQLRVEQADLVMREQARSLGKLLLGPVEQRIAGKRLIIVPDGPLHSLPFAVLDDPGSGEPLIDDHEIAYEPSALALWILAQKRTGPSDSERPVAVFADPVFSSDDERATPSGGKPLIDNAVLSRGNVAEVGESAVFRRLRSSAIEAEAVSRALSSRSVEIFSGFDSTRDRFLQADLSPYAIIHIASHAVSDHARPERSAIVLSGVSANGEPRDRMVRLYDIDRMNLMADLVVLSACDTAGGKELRGEGVLSLNNAFINAGARSVVSTMWKIDDEAATAFTREFYRLIGSGLTPSDALRRAQEHLRASERFNSPFFWGAFALHGDPDVLPFGNGGGSRSWRDSISRLLS